MNKRGQVTIFIILAILIVASVVLFFVFRDNLGIEETKDIQSSLVVNFVEGCMDETLNNSIYAVAANGGYSGYSYLSRQSTESGVRYYFFRESNYMPSKSLVEKQIEEYFKRKFFICINDFSDFNGYSVEEGLLKVSVRIKEEKVVLEADYPLTIVQGKNKVRVRDFKSEIPSRLNIIYSSVKYFIDNHKNRKSLCLGCLKMAIENDIYIDMESSYDGTVVFIFRDNSPELNSKPIEWVFANKY